MKSSMSLLVRRSAILTTVFRPQNVYKILAIAAILSVRTGTGPQLVVS